MRRSLPALLRGLRITAAALVAALLLQGAGSLVAPPIAKAGSSIQAATTAVNVRTKPTTSAPRLGVLYRGQKVTAISTSKGWTKVKYKGKTAYVYSAYLKPVSSSGGSNNLVPQVAKYTTAALNLRTGPSLKKSVYKVVPKGTKLTLTGKTSGSYTQVKYGGKTLWAATSYLSSKAPSTGSGSSKTTTKYTTAALNLRTGPSLKDSVYKVVSPGTKLTLTGKTSGNYSQIKYGGKTLWAATQYLSSKAPSGSGGSAPKIVVKYTTTALNLRTGPSLKDSVHIVAPKGTKLTLTGKTSASYTQVKYGGKTLWAATQYLSSSEEAELNRGYSKGLEKTNKYVKTIVRYVWANYSEIKTMYGWRNDPYPDHPGGRAVDIMIPDYKNNKALGWKIAKFFKANAKRFNINYIIFDQQIWNIERDAEGWRKMADRGGDSANHINHIHITTYDP